MKLDRKKLVILLAAVLALVVLAAVLVLKLKGSKDAPPEAYQVGEESISALVPEEGATVAQEDGPTVYTYEGITASGETAKAYMDQLTAEEFTVVDETYRKTDAPDFTVPEGTVQLAKNAAEEGKVLSVQLAWTDGACTVTVDAPEGQVDTSEPQGMSLMEAEDHFRRLSPSELGLEGTTMSEYQVYSLSGAVVVDGEACIQMNVYSADNPEGTNEVMGMYLMCSDGSHIYRLLESGGPIEKLM